MLRLKSGSWPTSSKFDEVPGVPPPGPTVSSPRAGGARTTRASARVRGRRVHRIAFPPSRSTTRPEQGGECSGFLLFIRTAPRNVKSWAGVSRHTPSRLALFRCGCPRYGSDRTARPVHDGGGAQGNGCLVRSCPNEPRRPSRTQGGNMRKRYLTVLVAFALAMSVAGIAQADHPESRDDPGQHGPGTGHLRPTQRNVELLSKLDLTTPQQEGIADVGYFKGYAYLNARDSTPADCPTAGGTHVVDVRD